MKPEDEKLAGDELEKILKSIGADELAKAYEEATGNDCGCDERKEWLNNLHLKFKRFWNKNFKRK